MLGKAEKILEKAQQQEEKSTRSLLDQYYESIAVLRKKNWTFVQIAKFLNDEGVEVSANWVSHYWLRRHGPAKKSSYSKKASIPKGEVLAKVSQSAETFTSPDIEVKKPYVHQGDLTDEERKELRQLKSHTSSHKPKIWND